MGFKDHFSRQAADYGRFRPRYPPELVAYVAAQARGHGLALDVATGNGQAALALAEHFELVLASDASATQLAHAAPHPRVRYLRHAAERLPLAAGVADLLVVAQAVHWFELASFYAEARRVLQPDGLVALWAYERFHVDAAIDAAVEHFYQDVVGGYWPPERRHVESGYRSLPFPFAALPTPPFELAVDWTLERTLSYFGTWSAVDRYRAAEGRDPLPDVAAALTPLWPEGTTRRLRWQIHLRLGRSGPI